MTNLNLQTSQPTKQHHYIRAFFSSFFGFIAIALIIISILALWLNRTLTNTDHYVSTVAPLVTEPDVQNFIVDKASNALVDNQNIPIANISAQILGIEQIVGKTDQQLRAQVMPIVKDSFRSVVTSPNFATLWKDTNRNIHSSLITQLATGAPIVGLNFHPLVVGIVDQLGMTKLSFLKNNIQLKNDVGLATIMGKQLDSIRKVYASLKTYTPVVVGVTVLAILLCILISVNRIRTFRRIVTFTGIYTGILAVLLSTTSLIKIHTTDIEEQKMVIALVNAITHELKVGLIIVAVICVVGSIGIKIYEVTMSRRTAIT